MVDTPDTIVKKIITELCTNDFEGTNAKHFWDFVESACGKLDEFTKTVVWTWLLENPEVEVWRNVKAVDETIALAAAATGISGKSTIKKSNGDDMIIEDKLQLPDFQTFFNDVNISDYMIKITEDCQSIYLTGVRQRDNILGKMPYDLLRIIAKHKEAGINSIDLGNESGQDKRSFTTRLQILEDNSLITKTGVIVNKSLTNHMIHFRFVSNDKPIDDSSGDFYDRFEIILQIMDALKKADTKLRITKDLYEELKETHADLKLKWFNGILRFLVQNEFIELVQVELTERQRFYSAARLLKDIPTVNKRSELLAVIKEQMTNNELQADNTLDLDGSTDQTDLPMLTRFFPLTNQMFNIIQKNPGITCLGIENELTGNFRVRALPPILETISTTTPNPENPNSIIGQMVSIGKSKLYKYFTQDTLNRRNSDYKAVSINEDEIPPISSTSLFQKSIEYGTSYKVERRVRLASLRSENNQNKYYLFPKSYKGELGTKILSKIPIKGSLNGLYNSKNNWIKADAKSKVVETNKDLYKFAFDQGVNQITSFNKAVDNSKVFLENRARNELEQQTIDFNKGSEYSVSSDVSLLQSNIPSTTNETVENSMTPVIDYGPDFRRNKLRELIDEKSCICINSEFCSSLSRLLKVEYTIDRRTLIKDALALEAKNLVKTQRFDNGKFVAKSVANPPTQDQISESLVEQTKNSYRKFTSKLQLDNLPVHNDKNLINGWKFADKEMRLQHAMENARAKVNAIPKYKRAGKRLRIINNGVEEPPYDDNDKNVEQNYEKMDTDNKEEADDGDNDNGGDDGDHDDDDIFEPLMDNRKRKKFKAAKPQTKLVKAFKKIRTSVKIPNDHILLLIKAIIITQSFSNSGNIEWPIVVKVLDNMYPIDALRRQWPKHRKMLGPRNLMQAKKNWETALMDAVTNGEVTVSDLDDYDIFKMLDVWKSHGADIFLAKANTEILADYDENFNGKVFKPLREEYGSEVFRESSSMIVKEQLWTSRNFMYPVDESESEELAKKCETPSELNLAKTKLKALFATHSNKFNSSKVRELFSDVPTELYSQALTELENEKAIAFLGEDSKIKFTLTDRLMLSLDCKLTEDFVDGAKRIVEVLDEIDTSHNGLLLSPRCPTGSYAPLFSLLSDNNILITRIDQQMESLETYYTKALDRSKLESDFLLSHYKKDAVLKPKKIPAPMGKSCSFLWVDLEGDFNEKLWNKCLYVIIWGIVFHPGTPLDSLCSRLYPLLEPFEVKKIIDWLILRGNIVTGQFGGYWPTNCWFDLK